LQAVVPSADLKQAGDVNALAEVCTGVTDIETGLDPSAQGKFLPF
jgi:hypothetical protein